MKIFCLKREAQYVSYRSVLLIIFWDALMYLHLNSIRYFLVASYYHSQVKTYSVVAVIMYCLSLLSFPLFGLLADIRQVDIILSLLECICHSCLGYFVMW